MEKKYIFTSPNNDGNTYSYFSFQEDEILCISESVQEERSTCALEYIFSASEIGVLEIRETIEDCWELLDTNRGLPNFRRFHLEYDNSVVIVPCKTLEFFDSFTIFDSRVPNQRIYLRNPVETR